MPINAAYGFTMMLNKLIADEKPTHVIAAFDKGMPAERLALFADIRRNGTDARRSAQSVRPRAPDPGDVRHSDRRDRRTRGRRRHRDARATCGRGRRADDRRHRRSRSAADRRRADDGPRHAAGHHRTGPLRSAGGSRALRPGARAASGLPRPQGRSVRQPARHPRRRRKDREQAACVAGSLDASIADPT